MVKIAFKSCPERYIKSTPIFHDNSFSLVIYRFSFLCLWKRKGKKETQLLLKLLEAKEKSTQPTHTRFEHLFFSSSSAKPISALGVEQTRREYSTQTLCGIDCFLLFKRPQKLYLQAPTALIQNTTLLCASSHCKHAEFSTVPLTLTVSICPFTDSVLGGAPLEAETLTVEREMRICNNITGNKERHYERAITGWSVEQFPLRHWVNQWEVFMESTSSALVSPFSDGAVPSFPASCFSSFFPLAPLLTFVPGSF